jgi:hypothetical protein
MGAVGVAGRRVAVMATAVWRPARAAYISPAVAGGVVSTAIRNSTTVATASRVSASREEQHQHRGRYCAN